MAITVTATVGGASSNSYQTVAAISARAELLPGFAAWDALSDDEKAWCAIYATTLLERLDWLGGRVTATQRLCHPRYSLPKQDGAYSNWGRYEPFDLDAIAEPVLQAQAIIAVTLANMGGSSAALLNALQVGDLSSIQIGDIGLTFRTTTTGVTALHFPGVSQLLEGLHA